MLEHEEFIEQESQSVNLRAGRDSESKRLRLSVAKNSKRLSKMSGKDQLQTCAICLDQVTLANQATTDSCTHVYCFECIQQWVTTCSNTCPQCKKVISEIKQGLTVFDVPPIISEYDSDYVYVRPDLEDLCTNCNEMIGPDPRTFCFFCDRLTHSRCMTEDAWQRWCDDDVDYDYACDLCLPAFQR